MDNTKATTALIRIDKKKEPTAKAVGSKTYTKRNYSNATV